MPEIDERTKFFHLLTAQLQDNLGQRMTHALCNGILATLDAALPRENPQPQPELPADPAA